MGQNEDCSPGDITSYSSERLLQRGSGGRSMDKMLVKGKFNAIKHSFYKGVLLVARSGCHHEGIECFSRYEEMPGLRSGNLLPKISNYLRTYPTSFPGAQIASLSTLSSLQGLLVSSGSSTGRWQTPLLLLYGCWQMLLASASL